MMLRQGMFIWILLSLVSLIGCGGRNSLSSDSNAQRIAVLQLNNRAGMESNEVSYLSDLVRQAAVRLPSNRYMVMTQENIKVMLPPGKTLEDCIGECAVETGREVGADWILTGDVVKFGENLRVTLRLHNTKSGALKGSDVVKGDKATELEGPIQGSAIGLFAILDPSLKRVAQRLKRGFVFEKVQFAPLPSLPKNSNSETGQSQVQNLKTKSNLKKVTQPVGIDFGKVDVEGLESYEKALALEKDPSSSAQGRLTLWTKVAERVPELRGVAQTRVRELEAYIAEQNQLKRDKEKRMEEEAKKLNASIQEINQTLRQDQETENLRQFKMKRDWEKLSRLLKLSVVSEEDKLSWTEAFIESYGATEDLNPYWEESILEEYVDKLGNQVDTYVEESEREWDRRNRREDELKNLKKDALSRLAQIPAKIRFNSFFVHIHYYSSSFYIWKTEVTVSQYKACVESGVCYAAGTGNKCNWGKEGLEDHPINCLYWNQARTFAKWVGGDLPTEKQWKFAARGGEDYKYAGSDNVDEVGWYKDNSDDSTHLVGQKKANGYGLYDMSGNISEWTLGIYRKRYSDRVSLGGGYYNSSYYRVGHRYRAPPYKRSSNLGFRVVKLPQ